MIKTKIIIATLLSVFLFGCGASSEDKSFNNELSAVKAGEYIESELEEMDAGSNTSEASISTTERYLIKKGQITFETNNLKETEQLLKQASKKYKGYISNENEYQENSRNTQTLTIRVPSKNFDSMLNFISIGVDHFDYKNIDVEDVSEEFLDIKARVKTKKELEKRYLALLNKANSIGDILEIERELNKIRSDIESIEGRIRYLSNQIGYSTLTITFYERVAGSSNYSSKFEEGFHNGWKGLIWFFILLTNVWPFILITIIVVGIIIYNVKKGKRKKSNLN